MPVRIAPFGCINAMKKIVLLIFHLKKHASIKHQSGDELPSSKVFFKVFHSSFSIHHSALFFISFLFLSSRLVAQTSPLDRIVSIKLNNERLADVLTEIGQKGNFSFSYNAGLLDANRRIDLVAINKPVRQILDQLFKGSIRYKVRQQYVILQKGDSEPQNLYLAGYVTDRQTGQRLAQVSVFDQTTLASAVSNTSGYFRLKLPAKSTIAALKVSKQQYLSESLTVPLRHEEPITISLTPKPQSSDIQPIPTSTPKEVVINKPEAKDVIVPKTESKEVAITPPAPDSARKERKKIDFEKVKKWLLSARQFVHDQNIKDTLHREAQVSLLPFVGTNHLISGQVTNDFSLNLIAGYSGGVGAFEFGGFANLVRGNVSGLQLAGTLNLVGGSLHGFQFAGFSNHVFGESDGVQIAGVANTFWNNASGMQISGFGNFNYQNFKGLQIAGTTNITLGRQQGWQIAGFANIAGELQSVQIAPVNIARNITKGRQIGVFNIADSTTRSPIGLLSFVRKNGYRRFEFAYNELTPFNLTFKTGMRKFYNILTAGISPKDSLQNYVWNYGYGIGTSLKLNRRETALLNIDFTVNAINVGVQKRFNQLNRLQLNYEQRIGKRLTFAIGPSFNTLATRLESLEYQHISKQIKRLVLFDETYNNRWQLKGWMGYQVGLRVII